MDWKKIIEFSLTKIPDTLIRSGDASVSRCKSHDRFKRSVEEVRVGLLLSLCFVCLILSFLSFQIS